MTNCNICRTSRGWNSSESVCAVTPGTFRGSGLGCHGRNMGTSAGTFIRCMSPCSLKSKKYYSYCNECKHSVMQCFLVRQLIGSTTAMYGLNRIEGVDLLTSVWPRETQCSHIVIYIFHPFFPDSRNRSWGRSCGLDSMI